MARIVFAMGCSHGPMLATPPQMWHLRAGADRKNQQHWFRGEAMAFDALLAARADESSRFAEAIAPEAMQERFDACQRALDTLAERFNEARADVVILLGNDQREVFKEDLTPSITVYAGERIENIPLTEAQVARLPPGVAIAEEGHCPPEGATYPGAPDVADALVRSLCDGHFDVARSVRLPGGEDRQHGIPHAFGFLYRRIMRDTPPPSVPIFLNVGVAPNQPRAARCLAFGHALRAAIEQLPDDLRVAVLASGGMTHFVIDEALDRHVLNAFAEHDEAALADIPEPYFNGNTAEIKSWYPLAAAMHDIDWRMTLVDYVPCYRTEAGTGNAMAFAYWAPAK
ncbi:DODA-type extradiol aromatic ring-opening family dioxygenase [Pandoraea sputorum]|uniref:DODA-type extradiol aromatic ring-opening family dioxygenase n=1 Tax=Pandoraea sputorum TaxID=93222 RepID=UPI0012588B2D|nr:protocatechuate 3,4-dioxygenase [Pandoraea sputorum]VVE78510.1 protocatechuate 3,4-dioxygenase [Pandoraea sputorum]